jgi:hypothetical protein
MAGKVSKLDSFCAVDSNQKCRGDSGRIAGRWRRTALCEGECNQGLRQIFLGLDPCLYGKDKRVRHGTANG